MFKQYSKMCKEVADLTPSCLFPQDKNKKNIKITTLPQHSVTKLKLPISETFDTLLKIQGNIFSVVL